jgi:UDP-2-acetamido-3-amino-2,3-dideoxy-glucuronate N-acetyltransferase
MPRAKIGDSCNIGQNVMIGQNVVIGNNVKIQNNISIFDGVEIADDVFLGPSMIFTNVINPRSFISRKDEFKKTLVKRGVTIGANATIICGNTIGNYAFIGAGAVVTKDVADYSLVVGNPARVIGFICECGIRLNFSKENAICKCGKRYRKNNEGVTKVR